jgi:hypothetical protein
MKLKPEVIITEVNWLKGKQFSKNTNLSAKLRFSKKARKKRYMLQASEKQ